MKSNAPYRRSTISLATKHEKQSVIAPEFQVCLGAEVVVAEVDTDKFGTFSGETERRGNALETAVRKARSGMKKANLPYGLASEGSFGPHPLIPIMPYGQELLVFVDDILGFTLHEVAISQTTNFCHDCVPTLQDARSFVKRLGFPSHGIILRPNVWTDRKIIYKDTTNAAEFKAAFSASKAASSDGKVWLEADMRAHRNPTRMASIGRIARTLADRLATPCPACKAAGWGRVRVEEGLPCECCQAPTDIVAYEVFGCVICAHSEQRPRSDGLKAASPSNCSWCNP